MQLERLVQFPMYVAKCSASALLLHKDFLFTFNSNNIFPAMEARIARQILHCVNGSVCVGGGGGGGGGSNPVPCHISMA